MTQFLRSLISARNWEIKCPGFKSDNTLCNKPWEYPLCRKVGVLTIDEQKEFEEGFEKIFLYELLGGKECPFCNKYVVKPKELVSDRVKCPACKGPDFCYKCVKPWKSSSMTKCGQLDCDIDVNKNEYLKTCALSIIDGVANVPKVRACPNCQTLTEHKEYCRHMTCTSSSCKKVNYQYCFICLKPWTGHNSSDCKIAPR